MLLLPHGEANWFGAVQRVLSLSLLQAKTGVGKRLGHCGGGACLAAGADIDLCHGIFLSENVNEFASISGCPLCQNQTLIDLHAAVSPCCCPKLWAVLPRPVSSDSAGSRPRVRSDNIPCIHDGNLLF